MDKHDLENHNKHNFYSRTYVRKEN